MPETNSANNSESPSQPEQTSVPHETQPSLFKTVEQTELFLAAQIVSTPIIKALKIPVGNTGMDEETMRKLFEKPLKAIILGGAVAPLMEETIFRLLPSFIVDRFTHGAKGDFWQIGIPIAAVFAGVYNATKEGIKLDKIPLYQFVGGLFFWYMMRERGFPHAVVAHMGVNAPLMTLGALFYKASEAVKKSSGLESESSLRRTTSINGNQEKENN